MNNFKTVINWKKLIVNCEKYIQYLQQNIAIKEKKGESTGELEQELNVKLAYIKMLEEREEERQENILATTLIRVEELPSELKKLNAWLRKNKRMKTDIRNAQLYNFFEILQKDFTQNTFPDDEYANDAFLILKNELAKHS